MAETKVSLGQAIDQIISALEGLDQNARLTAISAACNHLNIQMASSDEDGDAAADAESKGDQSVGDATLHPTTKHVGRQIDIRSLKAEKNPHSATEMACLVAYYLQELAPKNDRKQKISAQDVEKYFKQASFKLPKRLDQLLVNAKASGYFCQPNLEMSSFSPSRNVRFTSSGSSRCCDDRARCGVATDESASA